MIVLGEAEGCIPFSKLATDDGSAYPQSLVVNTKTDIALLPFSSGTTGLPKAVMLNHHSVVANLCQLK